MAVAVVPGLDPASAVAAAAALKVWLRLAIAAAALELGLKLATAVAAAVALKLGLRLATAVAAVDLGSQLASAVAVVVLELRLRPGSVAAAAAAVVVGLGPWLAAVALHQQKSRWCQLPCS